MSAELVRVGGIDLTQDEGEFVITDQMLMAHVSNLNQLERQLNAVITSHPEYEWLIYRNEVTLATTIRWKRR